MGNSEDMPVKASKAPTSTSTPTTQPPTTSTAAVYDWSGFQAYPHIPPHGFFHSSVASSPQAHLYMWGAQHLMPPYGTPPPPYVAMYPHGGIYAHPTIPPGSHPFSSYAMPSPNGNPEASGTLPSGAEVDGKSSDGKERSTLKRSKESLGSLSMLTGKNNELAKTSGASADGVFSLSAESGSEGSSEGSDANSQNDSQQKTGSGQDSLGAEISQNGNAVHGSQNGTRCTRPNKMLNQTMAIMPMHTAAAPGGVSGPTTNLNIGMDYWGAPAASSIPPLRGTVPSTPVPGTVVSTGAVGSRDGVSIELWALLHACISCSLKPSVDWIAASDLEDESAKLTPEAHAAAWETVKNAACVLVPGGFGDRGVQGMILAAKYARENHIPYLGICLGMQISVIEFARSVLGLSKANSREFDDSTPDPVVIFMPEGSRTHMGNTMRLGSRRTFFQTPDCISSQLYHNSEYVDERHRHRYEVNPDIVDKLEGAGLKFVGKDESGKRMEILELPGHPFYVGAQFHPEFKSRPGRPSALFLGLVLAAIGRLEAFINKHKNAS